MSDYQLIPILGRIARLREILEKYDLDPQEKLWVTTYLDKLEGDKKSLETTK